MNDTISWAIPAIIVAFMLYKRFAGKADPKEARRLVEAGATLLDVRSGAEFGGGHIPGAINIPVGELQGRLGELGAHDKPVVVYCASGMRSSSAKKMLTGAGFQQVLDIGPMSAW